MAFNYVGSINGAQRNLVHVCLYDSETYTVGDCVKTYVNGYAQLPAAATPFLGVIHAIVDKNQLPIVVGSNVAGTAASPATTSVTTAANNTTTKTYWALVDSSVNSLYSAEVSGTLGTTVSSTLRGCRVDIDSATTDYGRLLETTATRTIGTPANFYSHGLDPNNSSRLIVSIAISEMDSVDE
jgi:hypothetical protein